MGSLAVAVDFSAEDDEISQWFEHSTERVDADTEDNYRVLGSSNTKKVLQMGTPTEGPSTESKHAVSRHTILQEEPSSKKGARRTPRQRYDFSSPTVKRSNNLI